MGYLDELSAIFGTGSSDDGDAPIDAEVVGSPLDIARRQIGEMRSGFHEGPEGTFTGCGTRFGCGYAEATVVVNPETGLATVDVNSHLRVPAEQAKGARKLFRRLNQSFIIPGLMLDEDNVMHFRPERPCNLLDDGDISEFLGKGFSTIHAHAHIPAQLAAGREPWDILHDNDGDDDDQGGVLDRLRRLMED